MLAVSSGTRRGTTVPSGAFLLSMYPPPAGVPGHLRCPQFELARVSRPMAF